MLILLLTLIFYNTFGLAADPEPTTLLIETTVLRTDCSPRLYRTPPHSKPPPEDCYKAMDLIPSGRLSRNFRVPAVFRHKTCTISVETSEDPGIPYMPKLPAEEAADEVKANSKRIFEEGLLAKNSFVCCTNIVVWSPGSYFPCKIIISQEWDLSKVPGGNLRWFDLTQVGKAKIAPKIPETSVSKLKPIL